MIPDAPTSCGVPQIYVHYESYYVCIVVIHKRRSLCGIKPTYVHKGYQIKQTQIIDKKTLLSCHFISVILHDGIFTILEYPVYYYI